MNTEDRQEFLKIVIGFAELKGKKLSSPALELYWNAMQDWSIGDFSLAANRLIKTAEFMPTPKDFEDLRRAGRMTAGEAWSEALHHAACSAYRRGPLGVLLIDRVVHMLGGYIVIAQCDESKLHFLERRFCEHFEIKQDAEDTRAAVPEITFTQETKSIAYLRARLEKEGID